MSSVNGFGEEPDSDSGEFSRFSIITKFVQQDDYLKEKNAKNKFANNILQEDCNW